MPLYERAAGFGFPGVQVDGNDILAVMAVTREALERARTGGGPTFIEAYTYRMAAHTTSDDPTRYRHAEELEIWRLRDPIERLKVFLARQGIADRGYFDQVEHEADELAIVVRDGVRAMPEPAPDVDVRPCVRGAARAARAAARAAAASTRPRSRRGARHDRAHHGEGAECGAPTGDGATTPRSC